MATVDSHYARAILKCSIRRGFNVEQLMREAGLDKDCLDRQSARVEGEKITYMLKHTWAKLNDEFMGCTPNACRPGVFALMCKYALKHATLHEVLLQGIDFYNVLTDDIKMNLSVKSKVAELTIHFLQPQLDVEHFFHEFWLMIWHRFASWVVGKKITLSQVSFSYPKPAHHQELKNAFPCRHNFNQDSLKISFSDQYLTLSPVRTQHQLSIFLKNSPADLITIPGEEKSYKSSIRSLLIHQQHNILLCPDFETLAKHFNLGGQTLRRRLTAEGTSYPQIKDDIRKDMAIDQLLTGACSVADIGRALGFSESRSFSRAFKKWTGYNPTQYRQIIHE